MARIMAEMPRVYERETEETLVKELQWALATSESKSFEAKASWKQMKSIEINWNQFNY